MMASVCRLSWRLSSGGAGHGYWMSAAKHATFVERVAAGCLRRSGIAHWVEYSSIPEVDLAAHEARRDALIRTQFPEASA